MQFPKFGLIPWLLLGATPVVAQINAGTLPPPCRLRSSSRRSRSSICHGALPSCRTDACCSPGRSASSSWPPNPGRGSNELACRRCCTRGRVARSALPWPFPRTRNFSFSRPAIGSVSPLPKARTSRPARSCDCPWTASLHPATLWRERSAASRALDGRVPRPRRRASA